MGTFAKQKLVVGFLFWAAIFWQKDTSSVPSQINEAVGRSEKKKKKNGSPRFQCSLFALRTSVKVLR